MGQGLAFDTGRSLLEAASRQEMDIGMFRTPFRGSLAQLTPRRRRQLLVGIGVLLFAFIMGVIAWNKHAAPPAPQVLSHTYEQALEQAHNGQPGAARVLYQQLARNDLSDIRRASLLAELGNYPSPQALKLLSADLRHESALVRLAAIDTTQILVPDGKRSLLLGPLLDDPDISVRRHAVNALLDLTPDDLGLYYAGLQDNVEAWQAFLKSQPPSAENQLQLARLLEHSGNAAAALAILQQATQLEPKNLQAALAYIDLLDRQGQTERGRQLLGQLLVLHPDSSRLQHALGKWLLQHDQTEYALLALAKAVELEPDNIGYRYDLAVALHDLQELEAAQKQLAEILQRQPANRRARVLLISYWKENGQLQKVQVLQAELEQQNPDDPELQQGL
jgi:tetratricopeptide (TPR) repeat protein